jgi:hypothetical protein
VAYKRDLAPARSIPFFILSLFILSLPYIIILYYNNW